MSDQPATAGAIPHEPTPGERLERSLPEWQRWLNRFCENWIFAFIVAMAVRHFCLEAFRIPTASMEPMLYGEPAFTQSDHVVVDKLVSRFRAPRRWDVTVFQFPQPEVRVGGEDVSAIDEAGKRRDRLLTNPLSFRNFVKRAVVLPGDVFYFAHGDLFLRQPDGSWAAARKPDDVQEALWQDVYRHADAPTYQAWKADQGAAVEQGGERIRFQVAPDAGVRFLQPLNNLYLKAGKVRVQRIGSAAGTDEIVDVAMTAPTFTLKSGVAGNIWHLDDWQLSRLTSVDLDSRSHGTELNAVMNEQVADIRIVADIVELDGWVVLRIAAGPRDKPVQRLDLRLAQDGWRLEQDGALVGSGADRPLGDVRFASIDDQAVVTIGGREVARVEIPPADPQRHPTAISWSGEGAVACAGLAVQRDVHYSRNGFLAPLDEAKEERTRFEQGREAPTRERRIDFARHLRLMREVRAAMRGVPPDRIGHREEVEPWGFSPETCITAPADGYLMLGDNSPLSWDGRNWGWVPGVNLRGRVLAVVLWPRRWHVVR